MGEEPDYRFTLANERTFLAWMRTALGILACSVAIVHLVPDFSGPDTRRAIGCLLAATSVFIASYAGLRWWSVQKAMRQSRDLPHSGGVWLLAGAVTSIGAIVLCVILADGIGN